MGAASMMLVLGIWALGWAITAIGAGFALASDPDYEPDEVKMTMFSAFWFLSVPFTLFVFITALLLIAGTNIMSRILGTKKKQ